MAWLALYFESQPPLTPLALVATVIVAVGGIAILAQYLHISSARLRRIPAVGFASSANAYFYFSILRRRVGVEEISPFR